MEILFLSQRLPYPPDKGDKIRSWHELEHLAARHAVHLACLVDDPEDLRHVPMLERLCASVSAVRLDRRAACVRAAAGLAGRAPLTYAWFRDRRLRRAVSALQRSRSFDVEFVFCSSMVPYVEPLRERGISALVCDLVDVDSRKWHDYATAGAWPISMVYAREARLLGVAEIRIATQADACLLTTAAEAKLLRDRAPFAGRRIHAIGNGVAETFFEEGAADAGDPLSPWTPGPGPTVVLTGAMDYPPNIDAAAWFAEAVLPRLRAACPSLRFAVVGARPSPRVRRLARHPGVVVTGRVPDVRPFIAAAEVAVAPLRIARGIQNKVLEAMAMGKPVVATPQALEGLEAAPGHEIGCAPAEPRAFAQTVLSFLERPDRRAAAGAAARSFVERCHAWPAHLAQLDDVIAEAVAQRRSFFPRAVAAAAAPA